MGAELWKSLLRPRSNQQAETTWTKRELIDLLLVTPTPVVADAMDGRNVLEDLKPVLGQTRVAGHTVTAQTDPMDWGTTVRAIESASAGDILFIESENSSASVWGGLASQAARQHGLAGTIVYGGCRDVATIRRLGYPTWSLKTNPRAGKPLNKGRVNVPLVIDGVTICPKDLIVADDEGVAVIPMSSSVTVANKIVSITAKEQLIEEGLKAGMKFSDLLDNFPP